MRGRAYGRESLFSRVTKAIGAACLLWSLVEFVYVRNAIVREGGREPAPLRPNEKIFITSIQWTSEKTLADHWIPALVELAQDIGRENVFVSIAESGSLDGTKDALNWLDALLEEAEIPHRIVLDDTTHLEAVSAPPADEGWIWAPHGEWELRRVPYLAQQRNLALQPLHDLHAQSGLRFDKVLFLNDVVFRTRDVRTLLATRDGEYAAACTMDFKHPAQLYDTFALRDADGHPQLTLTWPYFRASASRRALKASMPIPVTSCWNGIVAMDAAPFYSSSPSSSSSSSSSHSPEHALAFRGIPDSLATRFLEGSECCLIHADNPLSATKGVWLNPNVRVGYNAAAYEQVYPARGVASWVGLFRMLVGPWSNRLLRWTSSPAKAERSVLRSLVAWEDQDPERRDEPGAFCLVREMQILTWNGWAHV